MLKNILFLFFLLTTFAMRAQQENVADTSVLHNKIQWVTIGEHSNRQPPGCILRAARKPVRSVSVCDKDGNATWIRYYDTTNHLLSIVVNTYKDGYRVSRAEFNADSILQWKEAYIFDAQGAPARLDRYGVKADTPTRINLKPTMRKVSRRIYCDLAGIDTAIEYIDTSGKVTSRHHYNDPGYPNRAMADTATHYGQNGAPVYKNEYVYADGRRVTERMYRFKANGVKYLSRQQLYNDKGAMTEVTSYSPDGKLESHVVYKYDPRGNRICTQAYDGSNNPNGTSWTCYFDFDAKGNWQKAIYWSDDNGDVATTTERVIVYY